MVSQNLGRPASAMGLLPICAYISATFSAGGVVNQHRRLIYPLWMKAARRQWRGLQ